MNDRGLRGSPFDAWIKGDEHAIPEAANGALRFQQQRSVLPLPRRLEFTNDSFHDTGLRSTDRVGAALLPNIPKMMHALRPRGSARSNAEPVYAR